MEMIDSIKVTVKDDDVISTKDRISCLYTLRSIGTVKALLCAMVEDESLFYD